MSQTSANTESSIYQRVVLNIHDGIAYVKLSRADKHNALDLTMFRAIVKAQQTIAKNPNVRVVIVHGAGESFCSGLDVRSVLANPLTGLKLLFKWLPGNANLAQQVSVGWRRLKVPVIMVLHGNCWGGGMQIALGGDFRIAANNTSLSIMEARWGLIPDMGGTVALRENLAADHAKRLAMTAQTITAEQAQAINLVTVIADNPMQVAKEMADSIINRSPDAIREIKRLCQSISYWQERKILAAETIKQLKILLGKNQKIAVKREQKNANIPYR
ncbi:MAG: crotonase/enoyl-CoA hydratase family protein [Gammaproteobacteria bacterium]|nr:crotonase/enoyl-CoA hydratase family protein [Gammaproteobacteria bacterium]